MSKGSRPRPPSVSKAQFDANFDKIFGKKEGAGRMGSPQRVKEETSPRITEVSDSESEKASTLCS